MSVNPITVTGSDELIIVVMGFNDFDGFDLYFMIKFNFRKGKCANQYLESCNQ